MKRLASLLLCLCLILSLTVIRAEDAPLHYMSDFSEGTDGWYARSAGEATVSVEGGALLIEGRTAAWNSPGRDFPLIAGDTYEISVQISQSELTKATFIVSVAHSNGDLETYENLVRQDVAKGVWTTVTCTYTPGPFDRYVLYVETSGDGTIPFRIRRFSIRDTTAKFSAGSLPSLKETFADDFLFGGCVNGFQVRNSGLMSLAARQYAIVTCENEMKPDALIDVARSRVLAKDDETAVAVHFDSCKAILDWAWANGLKMHGHVFVWHSQTPEAFFREGYSASGAYVSREVMLARLEHFMQQTFDFLEANYPGMFVSYDICNEVIDDGTGRLRTSNWYKVVGEDFVARAFEIARRCAPEGLQLYLNDYNTAWQPKQGGIVQLLNELKPEGNIDGYGLQMHHAVGSPSIAQIRASVEAIAATGLRIRVSELDVGIDSTEDASLRAQADFYAAIMDILKAHADQVDGVQVWGILDSQSWRSKNHPLLFDGDGQPKYAFWALTDPSRIPQ
ncbi:MAG: endo-1,4-beta-xylanase [Clostridia bacterium]|nr:endo-1,4-beta-xylanase [Clostridia bacterium]